MANRKKPCQIKFALSELKKEALDKYLETTNKTKQDILEAYVDLLIEAHLDKK